MLRIHGLEGIDSLLPDAQQSVSFLFLGVRLWFVSAGDLRNPVLVVRFIHCWSTEELSVEEEAQVLYTLVACHMHQVCYILNKIPLSDNIQYHLR